MNKNFRDIMVKRPWGRIQPSTSYLMRSPVAMNDMRETPIDEPLFKIITQSDMLREFYPSGHLINSEAYYPNIYREEVVDILDDNGDVVGHKTNRYEEHVPRYAFSFQKIITIKQIVHLVGNDVQWDMQKKELTQQEIDDITEFRSGWLKKNMELALYELIKSVKIVADGAIVGYIDNGKFGWKALSFFEKGDTLYPHYSAVNGKLDLFARAFSDYDEEGSKVTNWLEVWDDKYLYRYKQDLVGAKRIVNKVKEIFGLSGYTLAEKKEHGFPFIPVCYHRTDEGACWSASQDSIDGYELGYSEMAQNNHMFGVPTLYLQGENVEAVHDMNGTIRVLTMGADDKAGYLEAQSAADSYQKQLDIAYKMIYKQSFAVETPAISGNSDISGAAIKILYADATEKATIDANEFQYPLDLLARIFAFGYGVEMEKTIDFTNIPISPWIKPFVHINESAVVSDLSVAVGAGFISKQTASERASFYTDTNEWDRIIKENKEQQQADLLYSLKEAQATATAAQSTSEED